jgi:hypothetical protein
MKTFGAIETGELFVICRALSQEEPSRLEKAGSVFWEAFWLLWSKGKYTRVILFSFSACSHRPLVSSFIFSLPHLQT